METQHIPKPTDTQILAAIEKGKSERLIAQELGTNCMRIHRLKKKHSLNFETKVTRRTKEVEKVVVPQPSPYNFKKHWQYETFLLNAY